MRPEDEDDAVLSVCAAKIEFVSRKWSRCGKESYHLMGIYLNAVILVNLVIDELVSQQQASSQCP